MKKDNLYFEIMLDGLTRLEFVLDFNTLEEACDFCNYNCPEIELTMSSKEDLKKHFGDYFIEYRGKYYFVQTDETLKVLKEAMVYEG